METGQVQFTEPIFQQMITCLPQAVVLINKVGNIVYMNPQAEKISGYLLSELSGKSVKSFISDITLEKLANIQTHINNAGNNLFVENKDGTSQYMHIDMSLLSDRDGLVLISLIPYDINDKILQQLKENKEKFKKAFEASPAGMAITRSSDTTFIEANPAFLKMTGYTKEEIIGKSSLQIGMIMDTEARKKILEQLKQQGSARHTEIEIKLKSAPPLHVLTSIETIFLQGEPCYLTIHHDITERKHSEKILQEKTVELARINKELQQFTYIASHDLQEPLRTVSNYIEIFRDDYGELLKDEAYHCLESISAANRRMSLLVKTLLDYSRLGVGKERVQSSCAKIIQHVITDLDAMIQRSGTRILVSDMPELFIYETEVHQLFQNLITNAIKFQRAGSRPEIEIRAEQAGDKWKFSVSDNGIGIEPKYFERIFTIFKRLHPSSVYEGSGIGLANCKKIIELHQGEIWLESSPGKGTTFYFTL